MLDRTIRGKTPMDHGLATQVFQDVIDVFNKVKLYYWIDYGTLLGAIREDDFIKGDVDIDIGFYGDPTKATEKLKEIGIRLDYAYLGNRIKKINKMIYGEKDKFVKLELMKTIEDKERKESYRILEMIDDKYFGGIIDNSHFKSLRTIRFKDRYVNIPNYHEKLLKFYYGNWEVPSNEMPCIYKEPYMKLPL